MFICLLFSQTSSAEPICVYAGQPHDNPNEGPVSEYRINGQSFDNMPGVSIAEGRQAIMLGAETWNQSTEAKSFRYLGNTNREFLPSHIHHCESWDPSCCTYSTVVVQYKNPLIPHPLALGRAFPRCADQYGYPTQFHIDIYARNLYGDLNSFSVGGATAGHLDIASLMAHEFGHTLNLGHSEDGDYSGYGATDMAAVMRGGLSSGSTRKRDTYYWDEVCVAAISPTHQLQPVRRSHVSGSFNSPSNLTFNPPGAGGNVSISRDSGNTLRWSAGFHSNSDGKYTLNLNASNADPVDSTQVNLHLTSFREQSTWSDRLFTSDPSEEPLFDYFGRRRVLKAVSYDNFQSYTRPYFLQCADWEDCSSREYVYSNHALSSVWDPAIGMTHLVWLNDDRGDESSNREINLAGGIIDEVNWMGQFSTVSYKVPTVIGQSSVTPGIACEPAHVGSLYRCILVYVSLNSGLNRVSVRRFYATKINDYFVNYTFEGAQEIGNWPRTSAPIAAWWHSDKYWIAYRSNSAGQSLSVRSSPDGLVWTNEENFGPTLAAPSAVSIWQGNNVLLSWIE